MTILDTRNDLTETLRALRPQESRGTLDTSAFTRLSDEMQKATRMFETPFTRLADEMQEVKGLGAALAQVKKIEMQEVKGLGAALARFDLAPFDLAPFDLAPFDLAPYAGLGAALAQVERIEMSKGMVEALEMSKGMVEALEMSKGMVDALEMSKGMVDALEMSKGMVEKMDLFKSFEALAAFKPGDGSIGLFSVTSGAFESFQPADAGQGIDLRLQADPDDTSYFCDRCKTELRVEIRGMWPTDLPYVGSFGLVLPCPKCAGPTNDGPPALPPRCVRKGNVYYPTFGRKRR